MATMSRTFTTLASALGAAALTAAVALAQQPRLTNGKVTTQPAATLQQAFRAAVNTHGDVGWVGYDVPVVDGERTMCCFNSGNTLINSGKRPGSPGIAPNSNQPHVPLDRTTFLRGAAARWNQPSFGTNG